ncbi:helix-turn-helix domain-containing protein [Nonlabens ponticola]|uniref:XRE family transcriptional regulator n=1 Tax=Nonlabens ponticola TaxID=2496866 RepID=A0A3S9MYE3_9FLAO|nr:helix-turn-helix transcriptional regulator [Nonlabens ponticola]AZQ44169.1 XRE family transcriptional regulator [Nonlabens ponticola]
MTDSQRFSKRLEQIMDAHDLNASSFAQLIGVGRSSISHILSGRNKPSLDFVMSVVDQFDGITYDWLLNGKDDYSTIKKSKESATVNSKVEEKTEAIKVNVSKEEIKKPTDPTQNKTIVTDNTPSSNQINKGKNISKVILIYNDGTFEELTSK